MNHYKDIIQYKDQSLIHKCPNKPGHTKKIPSNLVKSMEIVEEFVKSLGFTD